MIAVLKKPLIDLTINENNVEKNADIIVKRFDKIITEVSEDGTHTSKKTYKKVNLTKLANETAKLIKVNVAEEKIAEMRKALEIEENKLKEMKK